MLKRIMTLVVLLLAVSFAVTAQITTSSISGAVKNATDEPLVGATITATHLPSGTRYSTTTRAGGVYSISNMRVGGPYTIEISFVGFVTDRQEDIFLKLAETFLLNSTMKPSAGELTNVVVTTAARRNPILNAKRTGAVTNIGIEQMQRLPSISRGLNDFTRATPQASGNAIGGGNFRQNNFTIDGADFNNNFGIGENLPANGAPISIDAIEELSVNITPFDVRQSGFIGSAINAVTRSGTNRFTGSVYNYFRTEKNRGDRVGKNTVVRPAEEFDQWGFRLGGPIIKNKLFFFFSYETEKQPTVIQNRVAATPSAAFGSAPNISRPTAAELDLISDYLFNTYGYVTGPYQGYSTEINRKKYMGRLDWNISDKHKLNIRYSQVEGGEPVGLNGSRSPFAQYATGQGRLDNTAHWFKNSNYFQGANFYSLAAELNSTFGKLSNTFRATYTFQNDSRQSDSQIFPFVDILKDGIPFTSFGYEPFTFGNLRKVKTYSFVNNLSWTVNKHNWTVGAQVDLNETVNGFQRFGTSYYTFNSWDDFVNGEKPRDFGITYSLAPGFAQAFPKFNFAQYSVYGQDEIAVNKNFRLTLGLRLDLPTYPDIFEIQTHPLVSNLSFANGEKINTGNLPSNTLMWSPRVGFNWDLYGDRSLQIRGGTGIFTGRVPFVWVVSQSGDAGMLQVTQTFAGQASTPGPFSPDPAAYRPATPPAAGTVIPNPISALTENFRNPQTWKTSLAMDTRLPGGIIATIEGILNRDINTAIFRNANLVAPTALNASGNYPDRRLIYPSGNAKYINRLTNGLPNPNGGAFNAIVLDNASRGYYFSLTAKLEKQFRNGLFASLAYVKSMAENFFDGSGSQPLSAWQGVPGTPTVNGANNLTLGTTSYVIPDRIVATFSYRKEYFKKLATTISVFYSGGIQDRFSYTYSGDFNNDGANFDLIYVPRNASEIDFVAQTVNGVAYTPQQQSDIFFAFIEQDKYLRRRKGQYAERNGAQLPWRNQWDVKILQDVFTNIGKNRNTLQFSVDIFNFANLLNKDWGELKTANVPSLLVPVTFPTPGSATRPTFRLNVDRGNLPTNTYRDNVSVFSTYFMQFGIRYIFNN